VFKVVRGEENILKLIKFDVYCVSISRNESELVGLRRKDTSHTQFCSWIVIWMRLLNLESVKKTHANVNDILGIKYLVMIVVKNM